MIKKIVVVHEKMGIFLGYAMNLAFWSMIPPPCTSTAAWFEDESVAHNFLVNLVPPQDPSLYKFVEVEIEAEGSGVSIAELTRAGLGDMTGLMMLYIPVQGRA